MSSTNPGLDAGPGFSVSDTGGWYTEFTHGLWDTDASSDTGGLARKRGRDKPLESHSRKCSRGALAETRTFIEAPCRMVSHVHGGVTLDSDAVTSFALGPRATGAVVPTAAGTHASVGALAGRQVTQHTAIATVPAAAPGVPWAIDSEQHAFAGRLATDIAARWGEMVRPCEAEGGFMRIHAENLAEARTRPISFVLRSQPLQLRPAAGGAHGPLASCSDLSLCGASTQAAPQRGDLYWQRADHSVPCVDTEERYLVWSESNAQTLLHSQLDFGYSGIPSELTATCQWHGARDDARALQAYANACQAHAPAWAPLPVARASVRTHACHTTGTAWPREDAHYEDSLRTAGTSPSMRLLPPDTAAVGDLHANGSAAAVQMWAGPNISPLPVPQSLLVLPSAGDSRLPLPAEHAAGTPAATTQPLTRAIHCVGAGVSAVCARPNNEAPAITATQGISYQAGRSQLDLLAKARAAPSIAAALQVLPSPTRAMFVGGLLGLIEKHAHLFASSEFATDAASVFGGPLGFLQAANLPGLDSNGSTDAVAEDYPSDVADGEEAAYPDTTERIIAGREPTWSQILGVHAPPEPPPHDIEGV